MTETTIYETPNTLTLSYFSVSNQVEIVSRGKFSLEPLTVKTKSWKTVKFSVHNGLLFVNYGQDSHSAHVAGTRSTRAGGYRCERLSPQVSGLLTHYIRSKELLLIEGFIHRHFPDVEVKPLTEFEESCILDDLTFFEKNITNEEKTKIAVLCAKLNHLSFPVYGHFVSNRISDGFYGVNQNDLESLKRHRAKTYRDLLNEMFGTYRKDLAKAAASAHLNALLWASSFKGLVNIDTLVDGLRSKKIPDAECANNLAPISDFPKSALAQLFLEGIESSIDFIMVEDALEMARWIPEEDRKLCTSWKKLHDSGMASYSYQVGGGNEVAYPEEFENFFALADFEGFKVFPLRRGQDFIDTGAVMSVCVGSMPYITRAFHGDGYCFRIDADDNTPYALIEVLKTKEDRTRWKIKQVRGHLNSTIPEEFNEKITEELRKHISIERRN